MWVVTNYHSSPSVHCVLRRLGKEYTIELLRNMGTHTTFYVGLLKPYYQKGASFVEESPCAEASPNILVFAVLTLIPHLELGYLPTKPREILTSFNQLVAKRTRSR